MFKETLSPEIMLEIAIDFATKKHTGQKDKNGPDYIEHPLRVSAMGKTIDEKIVGVLHDVVEDTDATLEDLKKLGFSPEIIEAVDCISKRPEENHTEYLSRVKSNDLVRIVKLYDLIDNTDPARFGRLDSETQKRLLKKYTAAKDFLLPWPQENAPL